MRVQINTRAVCSTVKGGRTPAGSRRGQEQEHECALSPVPATSALRIHLPGVPKEAGSPGNLVQEQDREL